MYIDEAGNEGDDLEMIKVICEKNYLHPDGSLRNSKKTRITTYTFIMTNGYRHNKAASVPMNSGRRPLNYFNFL
ncbi:hypothetical protein SAMN05428961_11315 [Paenibacillus sp. OK060]|nr:hypothetical protein SAMN05428961_11315 [Paenibacillus sp. OK060]